MELHTLKGAPKARKNRKRVGRGEGSGHGKTSGRGAKGQKSRAGYSSKPGFEGGQMPLHRRLPKRGFNHRKRHPFAEINLDALEERFEEGAVITVDMLREVGMVKIRRGGVKVLGRGELTKRFTIQVQAASDAARTKIEQCGGTLEIIQMATPGATADAAPADAVPAEVTE